MNHRKKGKLNKPCRNYFPCSGMHPQPAV